MKVSIIVAIDEKNGIGKNNDLLFRIPEDFARMKSLTAEHSIVMGRKTFESIGRPLPNRYNVIITNDLGFKINDLRSSENFSIVSSLEEGIEKAKQSPGSDEIFIFGGGRVFAEAMEKNLVDRLYLTTVQGDYNADTFFPDYTEFKNVISEEEHESGDYKFKFLTLER